MDRLTRHFTAWKIVRAGTRELTDAIVAPEHRGPSPALVEALAGWEGAYYWPDEDFAHLVLIRAIGEPRRERWLLHLSLLLLTVFCTLGAGAALSGQFQLPDGPGVSGTLWSGLHFFVDFATGPWPGILSGWSFSLPLLGILLVHELGHYFTARRYAIDASPPYFLPVPPPIQPIGSLGAFIRLRSPIVDRRQLLDVGAAGPLAGFVVALAVMVWGYGISTSVSALQAPLGSFVELSSGFQQVQYALGESVLTQALRDHFFPGAASVHLSLPAFAGWVGAFITGLNLLPLSQLDGGHVLYGLLGRGQALVGFLCLAALLYLAQSSPNWYVWVVFTLAVGGGRWTHPSVLSPSRPVPPRRRAIGWLCVLVFILTFVPQPFRG